jgi:hypothetical protein
MMEKRAAIRYQSDIISICCSFLNSAEFYQPVEGKIKNFCATGLCAELRSHFKTGTVLVVRTTGTSGSNSGEDGIRTLALAEVKWSKPMSTEGMVYYATGLKYLMH